MSVPNGTILEASTAIGLRLCVGGDVLGPIRAALKLAKASARPTALVATETPGRWLLMRERTMLSKAQLAMRKGKLTASDLAAVLGVSPFRSAYSVWLEKTGRLEHHARPTPEMELGLFLEEGLIQMALSRAHLSDAITDDGRFLIRRNQWRTAPNGIMSATLDAISTGGTWAIEAKTAGLLLPCSEAYDRINAEWGEDGSHDVPLHVLAQVYGQMIACPTVKRTYVPALLPGRACVYVIERDDSFATKVEAEAVGWWQRHVVKGEAPEVVGPSTWTDLARSTLHDLRRATWAQGPITPLVDEDVQLYLDTQQALAEAQAVHDGAAARLLGKLDGSRYGRSEGFAVQMHDERGAPAVDLRRLQREHPRIYRKLRSERRRSVLRVHDARST